MGLKLTTWNVAHLSRVLPNPPAELQDRYDGIVEEIEEIDPDILCIIEGPGDILDMRDFVQNGLNGRYRLVERTGTDAALAANPGDPRRALKDLYGMQGTALTGKQWIWFLVKPPLAANAGIVDLGIWRTMSGGATWPVHFWGDRRTIRHKHWRHPQVLFLDVDGLRIEIIGVHMKSKFNTVTAFEADGTTLTEAFVAKALRNRIKLASEALDLRAYVDARFRQEPDPAIFIVGDMNDGPGKELFEREYLFFDLISNVQGEVFFARRFLNHALFDFAEDLRWSVVFKDKVDPERSPNILLDHILFTQRMVREALLPRVEAGAGSVEHPIHERINAVRNKKNRTSDHVPVSVTITR